MKLELINKEVEDTFAQENFRRIQQSFNDEPLVKGEFKFYSVSYVGAKTNKEFKHNLKFRPKDVIFLSSYPYTATITFRYNTFDATNIYFDTSATGTFRFLLGRYEE